MKRFLKSDYADPKDDVQEHDLDRDRSLKQLMEQNKDMMSMVLKAAPKGFLEMNIDHIGNQDIEMDKRDFIEYPPIVVNEKRKKKTKGEIRKEQEENFDKEQILNESKIILTTSLDNEESKDAILVKGTKKNSYDIGDLSEEHIFELTKGDGNRQTQKLKGNKQSNKKKRKEGNKKIKIKEKPQAKQKKAKVDQEVKLKSPPRISTESIEFMLLLLGGIIIIGIVYYTSHLNLL